MHLNSSDTELKKSHLDKEKVGSYCNGKGHFQGYEKIVLIFKENLFTTTVNQFGYKKKVGPETAIFTLKHVAHYYLGYLLHR